MPLSKKQFQKEVYWMFMTTKTSKILISSSGAILEDVLHLIDWPPNFLVRFLFFCFYPISSTSLLSNNIPTNQGSFWGSSNCWLQFKEKTNWKVFTSLQNSSRPNRCTWAGLLINCMCSSSQPIGVRLTMRFKEEEERFEVE